MEGIGDEGSDTGREEAWGHRDGKEYEGRRSWKV